MIFWILKVGSEAWWVQCEFTVGTDNVIGREQKVDWCQEKKPLSENWNVWDDEGEMIISMSFRI